MNEKTSKFSSVWLPPDSNSRIDATTPTRVWGWRAQCVLLSLFHQLFWNENTLPSNCSFGNLLWLPVTNMKLHPAAASSHLWVWIWERGIKFSGLWSFWLKESGLERSDGQHVGDLRFTLVDSWCVSFSCPVVCSASCVPQWAACVPAADWSRSSSWSWSVRWQLGTTWIWNTVWSSRAPRPPCLDTRSCCITMELTTGLVLFYLLFFKFVFVIDWPFWSESLCFILFCWSINMFCII